LNLLAYVRAFVIFAAFAAIAVPAKASTSFTPGAVSCSSGIIADIPSCPTPTFTAAACTLSFGTGSCTDASEGPGGVAASNWLEVSSGTISSTVNGEIEEVSFAVTGSANGGEFSASTAVPVSWDIQIDDLAGPVGWSLTIELLDGPTIYSTSPTPITGTAPIGDDDITGSSSITVPGFATITGYEIQLTATASTAFTLAVPISLNPALSLPEPSSLLLAGAGAVALFLISRKKRLFN
jgi:hypothetical protein